MTCSPSSWTERIQIRTRPACLGANKRLVSSAVKALRFRGPFSRMQKRMSSPNPSSRFIEENVTSIAICSSMVTIMILSVCHGRVPCPSGLRFFDRRQSYQTGENANIIVTSDDGIQDVSRATGRAASRTDHPADCRRVARADPSRRRTAPLGSPSRRP